MIEAEWETRKRRIDSRRPVKSRILTMLGRGTRKCPEINKTKFTVFDCFDGTLIDYFKNTTDFEIQPPTKTPLTIPQVIENIWQNVDRDYHVRILAKRLRRIEKDMSGEACIEFAKWIRDGQTCRKQRASSLRRMRRLREGVKW